ncbi:hypothetical protein [Anaerobaca lacustris]|uniref:Uncharacterized protein n=1 Tax=Anaerobaca lacustris TaxID=3044600 RepID=A0AAW6TXY2_9BACT|nr:hypothetical protein [Sedimentisphaerales bacterium M17dextr]
MSWRKTITDNAAEVLRFCGYLFVLLDAIVLSAFLFWFLAKAIWFAAGWLDRAIFSKPW